MWCGFCGRGIAEIAFLLLLLHSLSMSCSSPIRAWKKVSSSHCENDELCLRNVPSRNKPKRREETSPRQRLLLSTPPPSTGSYGGGLVSWTAPITMTTPRTFLIMHQKMLQVGYLALLFSFPLVHPHPARACGSLTRAITIWEPMPTRDSATMPHEIFGTVPGYARLCS